MTFTTYQTPAPLEAYLRRATLGLPPERREEVWNELEEHVYCRAEQLEWQGVDPEQALAQALRELGPPLRVSAAMNGVHNMPKMIAFGVAGMLAISAGLYALAGGGTRPFAADIPALAIRPEKPFCLPNNQTPAQDVYVVLKKNGMTCYTTTLPQKNPIYWGAYIGLNDIQKVYASAGLATDFTANGTLRITYPDGTSQFLFADFNLNGEGYARTSQLVTSNVGETVTPELRLSGYDNPTLLSGTIRLHLGTSKQPVAGMDFYRELIPIFIGVLTSPNLAKGWEATYNSINHRFPMAARQPSLTLRTGLRAGEVVMLITRAKHQDPKRETTYFADIAPVRADGTVKLVTEGQHLDFTTHLQQLATPSGKNEAVLVKVTNINLRDLKSGIFLPR